MSGSVGDNPYRASGVIAAAAGGGGGAVDWQTDSIKTAEFTAVAGEGYFCNTSGGAFAALLPAATIGDMIGFSDYGSSWDTYNLTITPNGSEDINAVNADYFVTTKGLTVTLIYVDATRGWKSVMGSDADATGAAAAWVAGTGGSPCAGSICGDYKTHSFTGPGTFTISSAGNPGGNNTIDYMVVAGAGSGGTYSSSGAGAGGGGGAGGYRESKQPGAPWCASPTAGATGMPAPSCNVTVTVGAGGAAVSTAPGKGIKGSDSVFGTITSTGGGLGGHNPDYDGGPGGSGGGAGGTGACSCGGTGNDPPTSPAQGTDGGDAKTAPPSYGNGGGGGATEAGVDGTNPAAGRGGAGATTCISESPVAYAGGGGGGRYSQGCAGAGSPCGTGGAGGVGPAATAGTTNRGGGGGGNGTTVGGASGAGGSGMVVIRYKFQN